MNRELLIGQIIYIKDDWLYERTSERSHWGKYVCGEIRSFYASDIYSVCMRVYIKGGFPCPWSINLVDIITVEDILRNFIDDIKKRIILPLSNQYP